MKRKLLFLVILISILPLSLIFADEERLFTLGGKNGWNSVYDRRNVTSTSGRYGYEALEIENASTIFDSDTDLIIIQMTDNVNTDAKISVFNKNLDYFITTIKQMCRNARIVWVHGWYNKYNTYERLIEISKKYSIELIDISTLRCKENESYSGQHCINAVGEKIIVRDTWITHPGNAGMKVIADKIIETLGI